MSLTQVFNHFQTKRTPKRHCGHGSPIRQTVWVNVSKDTDCHKMKAQKNLNCVRRRITQIITVVKESDDNVIRLITMGARTKTHAEKLKRML